MWLYFCATGLEKLQEEVVYWASWRVPRRGGNWEWHTISLGNSGILLMHDLLGLEYMTGIFERVGPIWFIAWPKIRRSNIYIVYFSNARNYGGFWMGSVGMTKTTTIEQRNANISRIANACVTNMPKSCPRRENSDLISHIWNSRRRCGFGW